MTYHWYKCKINVLTKGVQHLLENELFYDCTLAAEGQCLNAHKLILSAWSPYFQVLFSQQNDKFPIIFLKDVKFRDVKSLIDLMYYGKTIITDDQKYEFLSTIKSLQMKGLKEFKEFNNVNSCESNMQIDVSGCEKENGENIIDTNGETQIAQVDGMNDTNGNLQIESLEMADVKKPKYHKSKLSQKPGLTECNVEETSNINENTQISEDRQQKLTTSSKSLIKTGLTEHNDKQVNKESQMDSITCNDVEFSEVVIVQYGKSHKSREIVTVDSDDEKHAVSADKSQNFVDTESKSCKNGSNEPENLLPSKNANIGIEKSSIKHKGLKNIKDKTKASSACSSGISSVIGNKREYFHQESSRDSSCSKGATLAHGSEMLVTSNCDKNVKVDFSCKYCDKKFKDKKSSLQHEKTHSVFYCTDCDGRFDFRGLLEKHYNIYHNKCMKCMLVCSNQSELEKHKKSVHSDLRKKFICPWCGKNYRIKSCFHKHLEKYHNKGHHYNNSSENRQLPYSHSNKISVDNCKKKARKS